jgi:hypothetical protein
MLSVLKVVLQEKFEQTSKRIMIANFMENNLSLTNRLIYDIMIFLSPVIVFMSHCIAANGSGLADVPAIVFRLPKIITNVQEK